MGRFNFMDSAIQSRSSLLLCGLAVTVNARPADNLMVHKALQFAEPGDIVVVATGGNTTSAVFGGLMCTDPDPPCPSFVLARTSSRMPRRGSTVVSKYFPLEPLSGSM